MRRGRATRIMAATLCAVLASGTVACTSMWESMRQSERASAAREFERLLEDGKCAEALPVLERAQADRALGAFAAKSTAQKAICLERVGRTEEALAHRRLLVDFFADSAAAQRILPEERERLFALGAWPRVPPPPAVEVPGPRYSRSAERSQIEGAVVVGYRLDRDARVSDIRVLESPHPLLASWAIEAVAQAEAESGLLEPVSAAASFEFRRRWGSSAEQEAEEPGPWDFEWFPDWNAEEESP